MYRYLLGTESLTAKPTRCSQSYYFARDDRLYKAFVENLDKYKIAIQHSLTRRLKWQLRVLRSVLEGRTTTYRVSLAAKSFHGILMRFQRKVELLASQLDEGAGV